MINLEPCNSFTAIFLQTLSIICCDLEINSKSKILKSLIPSMTSVNLENIGRKENGVRFLSKD